MLATTMRFVLEGRAKIGASRADAMRARAMSARARIRHVVFILARRT